jgi:hypothetical protein
VGAVFNDADACHVTSAAGPFNMHHDVQGAGDLQPHGVLAHPGEGAQRREPRRHRRRCVGVDGATASGVSGVHGRQQFTDFGSTAFPHHQPVGPHPEGLADQLGKVNATTAF